MASVSIENVLETKKVKHGLIKPVTGLAIELMSFEKSSLIISQGIGPNPSANAIMKRLRDVNGNQPRFSASSGSTSWRKKNVPRAVSEIVMKIIDTSSRILLPALSTSSDATIVAIRFTEPMIIVEKSGSKFVPAA